MSLILTIGCLGASITLFNTKSFFAIITEYLKENAFTKTSAELLFVLQGHAATNVGDLIALLDSDGMTENMLFPRIWSTYRTKFQSLLFDMEHREYRPTDEELFGAIVDRYE